MALSIVKETIELESIRTDPDGNAFITKRINLSEGEMHNLLQVDMFQDRFPTFAAESTPSANYEVVISAYPTIPTEMNYSPNQPYSYVAAGDDSVMFKLHAQVYDLARLSSGIDTRESQFPSQEIAAQNKTFFYTDHVYINMVWRGDPSTRYENLAYSFLLVLNSKKVSQLTHTIGVLAESHDAMCAQIMSNGRMVSLNVLRGNTFPMWRYGGMLPEHMITPIATNAYFLPINTRDAEAMSSTPQIRQTVADSRQMTAFDEAYGDRRPDWLRMHLNAGIVSGPIRDQWPPIKHTDSGNVRML
jgi:hypothetical protein